jgi:hypothetical protein
VGSNPTLSARICANQFPIMRFSSKSGTPRSSDRGGRLPARDLRAIAKKKIPPVANPAKVEKLRASSRKCCVLGCDILSLVFVRLSREAGFFVLCGGKEKCAAIRNRFMPSHDARRYGSWRAHSFGLRAMSGVLLAFFLLPLFLPFFNPGSESNLPACCRRDGKHQCAMSAGFRRSALSASSGPIVCAELPPCPYRSQLLMPFASRALFAAPAAVFSAPGVSYPAPGLETILLAGISEFRSHRKRGPPSLLA